MRKITFEIKIIEFKDGKEEVIHTERPAEPAGNHNRLFNQLQIAVHKIINLFIKKEL